jgi:hypothetical protein
MKAGDGLGDGRGGLGDGLGDGPVDEAGGVDGVQRLRHVHADRRRCRRHGRAVGVEELLEVVPLDVPVR